MTTKYDDMVWKILGGMPIEVFDEDDDTVVFNSDKLVSELASDAHKKWTATFLLGAPTLSLED